jgi:CxxC motif-containing protein
MGEAAKFGKKIGDKGNFICIICPNSCRLEVEVGAAGEIIVKGNQCKRGEEYGTNEFLSPKRTLITTMKIENGVLPVLPVRSNKELPKNKIFEAVSIVNQTSAKAPIKMGEVIIKNILGLDVDVIASRDMDLKK